MRAAAAGPVLTMMLATGIPAGAELPLMPCNGCQLAPSVPYRLGRSRPQLPTSRPASAYDDLFHLGRSTAKGLTDHWISHLFTSGDSGFSIETVRRITRRSLAPERIGAPQDKLSAGATTFRYATALGGDGDSLSLGLTAGIEKRRFALDLARGHHVRSQSVGLAADWLHGAGWQLEGGYRFDFGSRTAPSLERGIELAEGAPRSQRGAWASLNYRVGGPDAHDGLSFGIRAQTFRLTEGDRLAMGGGGRTDNRLAFTTSFLFR